MVENTCCELNGYFLRILSVIRLQKDFFQCGVFIVLKQLLEESYCSMKICFGLAVDYRIFIPEVLLCCGPFVFFFF